MHCFFCRKLGRAGEIVELDARDGKHLFRTLRAKPGERVELTDGQGVMAVAEVRPDRTLAVLTTEIFAPPLRRVHLFLAPPKRQKMDILLKQCAEAGIWSITTMITARSVSAPDKNEVVERWESLLLEGCKQAKNPFLPRVSGLPLAFDQAVAEAGRRGLRTFFGSPRADAGWPLLAGVNDVAWFIGPEGGFTPEEEELLCVSGASALRLGSWVLRVETAAVAGSLLLQMP